jgi:hypothetical protein
MFRVCTVYFVPRTVCGCVCEYKSEINLFDQSLLMQFHFLHESTAED